MSDTSSEISSVGSSKKVSKAFVIAAEGVGPAVRQFLGKQSQKEVSDPAVSSGSDEWKSVRHRDLEFLKQECKSLREALTTVHNWLACAPLSTKEQMASEFADYEALCAKTLGVGVKNN